MTEKLYHYTSVDVLQKIIENGHFYAFNIKYSNDHQEYDVGYVNIYDELKSKLEALNDDTSVRSDLKAVIQKIFSEIPEQPYTPNDRQYRYFHSSINKSSPEVYFTSFTSNKDSLAQWEMYAKESGVSIAFNFDGYGFVDDNLPENLIDYFKQNKIEFKNNDENIDIVNKETYSSIRSLGDKIQKIVYARNAVKDLIDATVSEVRNKLVRSQQEPEGIIDEIIKGCFDKAPLIKGKEHSGEAESRLVFSPKNDVLYGDEYKQIPCHNIINHLNINGVLTPYMKVAWRASDNEKPLLHPIKSVIVGPGWNQDIVYKSIIHYLNSKEDKLIHKSKQNEVRDRVNKWFKTCRSNENKKHDEYIEYMTSAGILVKKSKSSHIFK